MNGSDAHLLDAYLDGLLSVDARLTFENELERSAGLRRQVNVQHLLDDALRRLFTAPAVDTVLAHAMPGAADSSPSRVRRGPGVRKALAVAAAILIAGVGIYRMWGFLNPPVRDGRYFRTNQLAMDTIYHNKLAGGFVPEWKCDTDERFIRTFEHQLFQPLVLMTPPPGVAMLGLGYCNTLSPHSVYMLAHVHDEKIIVFVDRLEADRNLPPLVDPQLRRFRREVGELVLYEVTPLDEARFLQLFKIPAP